MSSLVQFVSHNPGSYNDFKTLIGKFKHETLDVYYKDTPFSGEGSGSARFDAWAVNMFRQRMFMLTLEQDFTVGSPATSIVPATFLTDFPQAIALENMISVL